MSYYFHHTGCFHIKTLNNFAFKMKYPSKRVIVCTIDKNYDIQIILVQVEVVHIYNKIYKLQKTVCIFLLFGKGFKLAIETLGIE